MPEQQPLLTTQQPEKAKVKIDLKAAAVAKKSVDFANNNNNISSAADHHVLQQPHQPTSQTPTNNSSRDLSQVSILSILVLGLVFHVQSSFLAPFNSNTIEI